MKRILITMMAISLSVITLSAQKSQACDAKKEKKTSKNSKASAEGGYGAKITKDGAIDVKNLGEKMQGQKEMTVKIKGDVVMACQVKGCWMTVDLGGGKTMRMRFKDYAFFVPKDSNGKTFYAEGVASWNETSVAELQHYAEDAGKNKEEIAKITEAKKELVFLADGVLLENK